jgi:hypothetical protein
LYFQFQASSQIAAVAWQIARIRHGEERQRRSNPEACRRFWIASLRSQ